MKTKDNVVDDILKGLADYKPQAEPDWESFHNTYLKDIPKIPADSGSTAGGKATLTTGLRTAIIAIIAISGMIGVYFLFLPFDDADSSKTKQIIPATEQTEATPPNQNTTIIPDNNTGQPDKKILNSSGLPGNEILENTGSGANIGSSPNASNITMPIINEPPTEKGLESPSGGNETIPQSGDSLSDQPVLIKKTVIITDTVKVTRPHKK